MRGIITRLDADLGRPVCLAGLSGAVGLSASHFARKFRHSVGVSVNRFINRRRIRRAFGRLRAGSPELSRLALELGFSSQSHFTRVFSGLTGITPLQFRRLRARADARPDPG